MKFRLFMVGLLLLGLLAGVGAPAAAQEVRGTILGRVSDPQGAVVPDAVVVVTNIEMNAVTRLKTNATGYYEAPLMNAGTYSIAVEMAGFKKTVRGPVELSVGSRLEINVTLEIGNRADVITVTEAAPLLETTSASGGRVIDNREVKELPFSDLNPFALSGLAAGMQWTGQPEYRRPFDNGGTSAFNTAGGVGQNEYTLDGAPVTGTGRRVGFVPPSDSISEFKMETTSFDASYGHTSGATVNVATKSGTNAYHGSLYDQHWQQRWNATPHFTRLQYENNVNSGKVAPGTPKQASGRSNQFGATIGGPIRVPKIYNGKDKAFFFFSYNGIYQNKAETTSSINRTVPKMNWRQGDFSDLLAIDPLKYQIYDPRTARLVSGRVIRDPFPGNKGIPVLNPMYNFYTKLYPAPNNVPGLVSAEGWNNYYAAAMPKNERFNSLLNRVDYSINDKHKLYGRWYWNHRLANEYDWTYETMLGLHANGLTRINKGGGVDYVWTASGTTIVNASVSLTRFNEGNQNNIQTSFKPSDVGLPKYLDDRADIYHALPRLDFDQVEDFGGGYPAIGTRGTTGEAKLHLTKIHGTHTLKFGWDERRYWFTASGPGSSSGIFTFRQNYVRAADNTTTASNMGLEWAAFMMGAATGMGIDGNDTAYWSTPFHAAFAQDEWRLGRKTTLTLGLRWEFEQGTSERYNRGWSGDFNLTARLPFSDAVEAAYAASPVPGIPKITVAGGGYFLGDKDKRFTDGARNWLPRLGIAHQLNSKTVLRGGYGMYSDTFNVMNDRPSQSGFSQGTGTTMTTDNGLTLCCGANNQPIALAGLSSSNNPLINPFPIRQDGTRFNSPYRNTLGPVYWSTRDMTIIPRDAKPALQQRWRVGIQRQLRSDMVIDVSYNGAWSRTNVTPRWNYLPEQYFAHGNVRDDSFQNDQSTNFPNPFRSGLTATQSNALIYNYLNTQGRFTGSTISKGTLLRTQPNLGTITIAQRLGRVKYHDLQVQLEKRFSKGLQTTVLYTYAVSENKDWLRNEFDQEPVWRYNNNTRPHRIVWSGSYDFPFGKGQHFLTTGPLQHIVGGWKIGWVYQGQSGQALEWGNRFFYGGDPNTMLADIWNHDTVNAKDVHMWFDPSLAYRASGTAAIPSSFVGFEGRTAMQPVNHVRVFPHRIPNLRGPGIRNWDFNVKRDFRVTEGSKVRFAVDLLNATNHTNFDNPNLDPTSSNFGRIDTQRGLSRVIQFNLRYEF